MTLNRPHFIDKAWPNAVDLRKNLAHMIPREGIFPSPAIIDAGIALAGTGWGVNARAFGGAFKRQGVAYDMAYGTALGSNDGTIVGAWTLGGAPVSGSRIDRLWVRWIDPTQGEALTTPGGETVPRAVPVFGITAGTPAAQPWPAGVQKIAEASVPSGAASAAGATFTPVFDFAHVAGGPVVFRSQTEQDAYAPTDGTLGYRLDTDLYLERTAGAWVTRGGGCSVRTAVAQASGAAFTPVAVTWELEDYDTDGYHSTSSNTSRLVAPVKGIYLVTAKLRYASTAFAGGVQLGKNGSWADLTSRVVQPAWAGGGVGSFPQTSRKFSLNAGDYIEVGTTTEAAGLSLTVAECFAEMVRLA